MKLHASLSHRIGLIIAIAITLSGCDFIIAPPDGRPPSVSAAEFRRKKLQELHSSGALERSTSLPTDFYQGECGSYFNKAAPKTAKGGVSISTQFMIQGTITRTKPQGELQWRMDQAVLPDWNKATHIETLTIPKGQSLIGFEGPARAQGPYLGGGNQIYIPDVPDGWPIRKNGNENRTYTFSFSASRRSN